MRLSTKGRRRVISQLIMAVSVCVIAIIVDTRVVALPQTANEIRGLLEFIETSDCTFIRNGTEYAGPRARAHLEQKLNYLESKNRVKSAEDFIDLAATKSSMSGRADAHKVRNRRASGYTESSNGNGNFTKSLESSAPSRIDPAVHQSGG